MRGRTPLLLLYLYIMTHNYSKTSFNVLQTYSTVHQYSYNTKSEFHRALTLGPIFHCDAKSFALGTFSSPNANIPTCWYVLHWVMQIFRITKRDTPNVSQWIIGCVGSKCKFLALAMYISFFVCRFHLRWVANANPISSGIWALSTASPAIFPSRSNINTFLNNLSWTYFFLSICTFFDFQMLIKYHSDSTLGLHFQTVSSPTHVHL